jgi:hypothetical protein
MVPALLAMLLATTTASERARLSAMPRDVPLGAPLLIYLDSGANVSWTAALPAGASLICPAPPNGSASGFLPNHCKFQNVSVSRPARHIAATVPGEIVTDLQRARAIPDPLADNNFLNAADAALFGADGWEYRANFSSALAAGGWPAHVRLVFDSVKHGAAAWLNGHKLGEMRSQFRRYSFSVGHLLQEANSLAVVFNNSMNVHGRFFGSAGGQAYTRTLEHSPVNASGRCAGGDGGCGGHTFARGIVKSVYLAGRIRRRGNFVIIPPILFI